MPDNIIYKEYIFKDIFIKSEAKKMKYCKSLIITLVISFLMIIGTNTVIVDAAESKPGSNNFIFYFLLLIISSMVLGSIVSLVQRKISKIKSKTK